MFSRVGDDVSLLCTNVVYPNCSSTTWIYSKTVSDVNIEEVEFGKIRVDKTKRVERLSLGSDCSLNVSDVRDEDAGIYTCRQFLTEGGQQHGGDAPVKLSVLISEYYCLKQSLNVTVQCSTSNAVKLPISHIMLFLALTIMAAIVTIHTTRRNRPPKALHPQAEEASGIELQVLEE
ncbi:unnamed protein product, partial [Coregonus sp. 'balchen']